MFLTVGATLEYATLASRKSKLQGAVDAAALAGAQQLRISSVQDGTVQGVVRAVVAAGAPTPAGSTTILSTTVEGKRTSVRVAATETIPTVLGRLLSLPTMDIRASATAQLSGGSKLCMLALDQSVGRALNLESKSHVTAHGCAVYSNSADRDGIKVDDDARISAALICSAGGVERDSSAVVTPTPVTDCPIMPDPLAARPRPPIGSCSNTDLKITTDTTIYPGTYCGGIEVTDGARLTLMPGIYVINDGPLAVTDGASLTGQNAGLYFTGDRGGLRFDEDTSISLSAPKDGLMAGLLFFEDRSVGKSVAPASGPRGAVKPPPYGSQPMRQYRITSNNAPTLLGTVYLPAGRLIIDSSKPVADRSAYTVIVARRIEINRGPNLYLNTNYGATDVPVPEGVGNRSGEVFLSR